MILNFKEIPAANTNEGNQDTFELFAREFLSNEGYQIVSDPNRGADGKVDLIAEETLSGINSKQTKRWLVSCKHFAHSGKSVSASDEPDISDRLKQHKCNGFVGVYSTIQSSGLVGKLNGVDSYIYDSEKIENRLLRNSNGMLLAKRFFPVSFEKYLLEHPKPVTIFDKVVPLVCDCCGKELLDDKSSGICCFYHTINNLSKETMYTHVIRDLVCVCKGECDNVIETQMLNQSCGTYAWEEINDLKNPAIWLCRIIECLNLFYKNGNSTMNDETFNKTKGIIKKTFQYVSRQLTQNEKDRIKLLAQNGLL